MNIGDIIEAVHANRVRITDHADEEAAADALTYEQISFSLLHGEIVEDYPTGRPYPSCLIYGRTPDGYPIHSVWAYNAQNRWAVLITVYRPDPELWLDGRRRRTKQ